MTLPKDFLDKLPHKLPKINGPEDVPRYLEEQGLSLDDLNVRLYHLTELTRQMFSNMWKVSEGLLFPVDKEITGTTVVELNILNEPACGHEPWFSCSVHNEEGDDAYFAINSHLHKFAKIQVGETLELDLRQPRITSLYFKCNSAGDSARLRIVGER